MRLVPPLSLALVELPVDVPAGSDLFRAQVEFAKRAGFRALHLDAAAPGMRARDLGRSARRDVASLIRRSEMVSSGADLWIPSEHFVDAARIDRAVAAVLGAIELVSDLDRLLGGNGDGRVLCLALPKDVDASVISTVTGKAVDCGARIADFGAAGSVTPDVIGPGFDPAAHLLANPGATLGKERGLIKLPASLISARLSDAGPLGRVVPGSPGGRLDLLGYGVTLSTSGYRGHVALDVRGLPDQLTATRAAQDIWDRIASPEPN
jgi:hypothetical protein